MTVELTQRIVQSIVQSKFYSGRENKKAPSMSGAFY